MIQRVIYLRVVSGTGDTMKYDSKSPIRSINLNVYQTPKPFLILWNRILLLCKVIPVITIVCFVETIAGLMVESDLAVWLDNAAPWWILLLTPSRWSKSCLCVWWSYVWPVAFFFYFFQCCCTQGWRVALRMCAFVYVYCTAHWLLPRSFDAHPPSAIVLQGSSFWSVSFLYPSAGCMTRARRISLVKVKSVALHK